MSDNDLRPLLENRRLDDVLKDKKLFIVDYRILDGIKGMPNKTVVRTFYYPNSLFWASDVNRTSKIGHY